MQAEILKQRRPHRDHCYDEVQPFETPQGEQFEIVASGLSEMLMRSEELTGALFNYSTLI
ncbi:hypothetical protein [Sphingopyxis granuli]|uniref:hypothetical protein n=1 Tax=Sphingopyxis granuli TaxID=267128 RepID=UPI00083133ED|nr:hypothetical protein [Sphingopyxis granuli]